jgi:hypothetical protein
VIGPLPTGLAWALISARLAPASMNARRSVDRMSSIIVFQRPSKARPSKAARDSDLRRSAPLFNGLWPDGAAACSRNTLRLTEISALTPMHNHFIVVDLRLARRDAHDYTRH